MKVPHFRAFERRSMHLPARVRVGQRAPCAGRLLNIGLGGANVELSEYLAVGTRLTFELEPPNLWDPLRLLATVVWVRETAAGFSVGMKFEHEMAAELGSLLGLLMTEAYL